MKRRNLFVCCLLTIAFFAIMSMAFDFSASAAGTYVWPVPINTPITAGWYYPSGGYHGATDFGCPIGTPVQAIAAGTIVTKADNGVTGPDSSKGWGNWIIIDHGNKVYSLYGHLSTGTFTSLNVGDAVRQGEQIALSGNAGNSTGPHLHLELRMGGNGTSYCVDPQNYLTKENVPILDGSKPYADLGADFCGVILNTQHWKPISENASTEKITLETEYGVPTQRWRFIRQRDGSYVIRSCNDGKALEMTDGIRSSGTQLSAHEYWEGAYQKWYIIPQGNGYIIQSQHYTDENWVMELNGSYGSDGTQILINTRNDSAAQIWSIYATDEVALKANALSVSVNGAAATFNWNSSYGAQWYGLQIWTNPECTNLYHNEVGTSSGFSIRLPKGTYYAQYGVYDYFNWDLSGIVQFTINIDCADLGADFCGVILNTQHWKPIAENESSEKVTLETEYGVPTQRWRFIRQSDGSYVILSCNDGKALEMTDGIRTGGTQLTAHEYWGGYYQSWYLIPQGSGYIFQSKHYSDENWVMDLSAESSNDGTPIIIYGRNDSAAQIWSVYAQNEVQVASPALSVSVDNTMATFTWEKVQGYSPKWHDLKIWTDPECTQQYHIEWCASSGYSVCLPKGTYYAYVDACDAFNCVRSNVVQFTMNIDYVDIGDDFCGIILNTQHWKPITENTESEKITLETEVGTSNQMWHFARQSDGSYVIRSCYDGKALEMTDGIRTGGTQLTAHEYWDGNYQRWYLIRQGDGYIFQCKHFSGENWVMDLSAESSNDGTPIIIYGRNDSAAQIWSVYAQSEVQVAPAALSASVDNTVVTFTWNKVQGYNPKWHDLKIWTDPECTNPYRIEWGASSGFSVCLPRGTYYAYVDACDSFNCVRSSVIQFSTYTESADLGNEFYAYIRNQAENVYLTNKRSDIVGEAFTGAEAQIWKFNRQSNGTYSITSVIDNSCMDVFGSSIENNTKVQTYSRGYLGQANQEFYICEMSNAYYLIPAHTNGTLAVDMDLSTYEVSMWGLGIDWAPQEFDIIEVSYSIVYNANGGKNAPAKQEKKYGETINIASQQPTREGFVFNGWNTSKDVSSQKYASNAPYSQNDSIELFAIWLPTSSYTLPSSLKTIEEEAFANNLLLQVVHVPAESKLTTISDGAFRNCSNLIEMQLPASVNYIAPDAFEGCNDLILLVENDYCEEYALTHGISYVRSK